MLLLEKVEARFQAMQELCRRASIRGISIDTLTLFAKSPILEQKSFHALILTSINSRDVQWRVSQYVILLSISMLCFSVRLIVLIRNVQKQFIIKLSLMAVLILVRNSLFSHWLPPWPNWWEIWRVNEWRIILEKAKKGIFSRWFTFIYLSKRKSQLTLILHFVFTINDWALWFEKQNLKFNLCRIHLTDISSTNRFSWWFTRRKRVISTGTFIIEFLSSRNSEQKSYKEKTEKNKKIYDPILKDTSYFHFLSWLLI